MKSISCTIEVSTAATEAYWYIAVPTEAAPEAALMFAAMNLGRVKRILFQDGKRQLALHSKSATIGEQTVTINKTWLDALWCLFIDTHLNGWTNTAHIDQDFDTPNGSVSVTFAIQQP